MCEHHCVYVHVHVLMHAMCVCACVEQRSAVIKVLDSQYQSKYNSTQFDARSLNCCEEQSQDSQSLLLYTTVISSIASDSTINFCYLLQLQLSVLLIASGVPPQTGLGKL